VNFTPDEIEKFYNDFEPICDYVAIENLHGWSRTDLKDFTLGNLADSFDGVPNVRRVVCAWPLYQMTINWNGTVQPCNEDWSWNNIVGDVNDESLVNIWRGKAFNKFRAMQLRGERWNNKACSTCWQTMSQLDDVDPYREQMLEKINGN
jgi:radical SAM protein with 4Fe4S-binding SPASM domain